MKKKVIIFPVFVFAVSLVIYGFTYKSFSSDNENVMTDEEAEHSQSQILLTVVESCMEGSNKAHGIIKNNSTVSSYKNAIVKVSYVPETYNKYLKPGLFYREQTINEVFPPHSEVNVEFTLNDYKNCIPTGWELINATAN